VHNFSLVHDDPRRSTTTMLRRGRPSAWAEFDEATARPVATPLLAEASPACSLLSDTVGRRELIQATLG